MQEYRNIALLSQDGGGQKPILSTVLEDLTL